MTRTVSKNWRVYIDGSDMSGYTRSIGPLANTYDQIDLTTYTDSLHGFLPGQVTNSPGTLNAVFDNTASTGFHVIMSATPTQRTVTVAIGGVAAPAAGDPVFCGEFNQLSYVTAGDSDIAVTVDFAATVESTTLAYSRAFGHLIHAKGAETAVNTGTSDHDHGAATAFGGFMAYHFFTSNGTATLKVQDASVDTNPSFGDLASSGVIDASATPVGAIVALGKAVTVERYTRWQVVFGTATTATFALSFVRALD